MTLDTQADRLLSRYDKLKSDRANWEAQWRECAAFVLPRKNHIAGEFINAGERRNLKAYDATAIHANELLASGLHTMLTNPATKFFGFFTGNEIVDSNEAFKTWADKATNVVHNVLNNSNFQTEVHENYLDMGAFGTSTLRIEEDKLDHVRFFAEPITEVTIDENAKGMVDTTFREFSWTYRQVVEEWGVEVLSPEQHREYLQDPNKEMTIVHAITPRNALAVDEQKGSRGMPYASFYIDKQEKKILDESGFREFPTAVPRWTKITGEKYGRSPSMKAMPDIKMINQMKKTTIRSAQKLVDPPMQAPDDGISLPVRNNPNALNYYRAGTRDRIEPILTGGRVDFGYQSIADQRNSIREAFFIDQLQLQDGPQMTATEVQQRTEEKLRVMGPILGRQHNEFLKPVIERVLNILIRKKIIEPAPAILEKENVQVQYISMIAKAQKAVDAETLNRVIQSVAPLIETKPEIIDNFAADDILKHNARMLGLPEKLLVPSNRVEAVRKTRAQMLQQQQQMEQEKHQAEVGMKEAQGAQV